ncbi:hypothetical protein ACOACO_06640 [Nocardioides sp. CPCC 205120]|uniref:hypothetical protein n=1 Tax=Nocardioides sp. CPCC 205120 TaxID=3406462 RepID=UPI003B504C48
MRRGRVGLLVGLTAGAVALGGCSEALPDFDAGQVGAAVAAELERTGGSAPDDISCGPLPAAAEEMTTCTYVLGDRTQEAEVVVTDVVDTDVEFTVEPTRTFLTAEQLTPLVAQEMTAEGSPGEVTCLDELDLDEGARVYCAQTDGALVTDLAVTAQSGPADPVTLEIEIDDRDASESGQ